MPKEKSVKSVLLNKWASGHQDVLRVEFSKIICTACSKEVTCEKKFQVDQHVRSAMHQTNAASKKRQLTLPAAVSMNAKSDDENVFASDICRMMVAANIPWNKLKNSTVKEVLQKYMGRKIPDESTLRKNYLPKLNETKLHDQNRICMSEDSLPSTSDAEEYDTEPLPKKRLLVRFPGVKKRNFVTSATEKPEEIPSRVGTASEPKEDSFDHLGRYVASLLRSMPENRSNELQSAILSMILKPPLLADSRTPSRHQDSNNCAYDAEICKNEPPSDDNL